MVVLGLDPGTATTGFGVVAHVKGESKLVDYGTIETEPKFSDAERLKKIYGRVEEIIDEFSPDILSIEKLFFNKNTRTALTVGQARGILMLAGAQRNIEIHEYTPLQVKQAIVGYGNATKNQVQFMVKQILKLSEIPKPDDAADALAVAICHLSSVNLNARIALT